ncbi:MAG: sodium/solute symporter [bacterium]|nr:MAG: sodium/solute symporter [bacterium]
MYDLESWDVIVIALYFAVVILMSLYFVRGQKETPQQYFLSNRNLGWIAIGGSLLAANISSEHFIGLIGYGASQGMAVANFELIAVVPLILLGWWIAPLFLKSNIYTVPEYFGKRFNRIVQLYLSGATLSFYLLVKISISLFAGGLLLKTVFDWDIYTSTIVILMITGMYTIIGGLSAVIYTSVFQAVIILLGIIILTVFGLSEVGGFFALKQNLSAEYFSMFKSLSDPDFPWVGIVLGAPILGIWYWCTDQYIVQRILSAKSVCAARSGTILTGFLKIFPAFFMVLVGLISVVIFPGIEGEQVLSSLLYSDILPGGLKGLVVIGILAALMSSLAGAFISASTLFTMDYYRFFQPNSSDKKLVLVGRLATITIIAVTILWIPLIKIFELDLFRYLLSLHAYFGPPIVVVFILGIFWKRMNSKAAIWTLVGGGALGLSTLLMKWFNLGESLNLTYLNWLLSLNDLYFAIVLFLFASLIAVSISLFSKSRLSSKIQEYMLESKELTVILHGKTILTRGEKTDQFAWIFSFVLIIILAGFWGLFF